MEPTILAYHQITQADQPRGRSGLGLSVCQFEHQMRYLHDHGYRCLSLRGLLRRLGSGQLRDQKSLVLTFDDGYQDFFTGAYPILQRYGFTATVFLVTDRIGHHSDWEGERGSPLLTWEQVLALQEQGISFGSHTCTHRRLSRLSNDQICQELLDSKQRLEAELGQEARWLAYPYGDSNSQARRMAMEAGYEAACGADRGRSGRFNLWRRMIRTDDDLRVFALKLTRWYHCRGWLREETTIGQFLSKVKRRWCPQREAIPE